MHIEIIRFLQNVNEYPEFGYSMAFCSSDVSGLPKHGQTTTDLGDLCK